MNNTATILGLSNTYFSNPHGLSSTVNLSTVSDLMKLALFVFEDE
jgi:D-alanyl-D-alanine carboxypeptidase